jgi:hypothetical protein
MGNKWANGENIYSKMWCLESFVRNISFGKTKHKRSSKTAVCHITQKKSGFFGSFDEAGDRMTKDESPDILPKMKKYSHERRTQLSCKKDTPPRYLIKNSGCVIKIEFLHLKCRQNAQ